MEVANLPSEDESSGSVTKRLLQGRPLPAILVDNQTASRYPRFRPHQHRPSIKGSLKDRDTSCDSGVCFTAPEGDPTFHMSMTSKSSVSKLTGSSQKKKMKKQTTGNQVSSVSSGISSGRASERHHQKPPHQLTQMSQHGRSTYMDGTDYAVNPDPAPFLPQNFMRYHGLLPFQRSSSMVKKIPIPKRHQDTFGGYEYNFTGQRGVMLHTDRYQFEALRSFEGLNQRDRLLAEMEYLEQLRSIRRRRELVPHRTKLDLMMGGKKIEFEERFDLNREIQKLKAMAMPQRARDLYHGKGILLPPNHMSIHPRVRVMTSDTESDEEVRVSAPASLQRTEPPFNLNLDSPNFDRQISLTLGDVPHARSIIRGKRHGQLPSLKSKPVTGMPRDDTSLSKVPSLPNSSRSAAWVQEQNQRLSHPSTRKAGAESDSEVYLTRQRPIPAPLEVREDSMADKRRSPEAPPPTTEGGPRPLPENRDTSPQKSHTPNPLKPGLKSDVPADEETQLRQTFQRLDTDADGHLQYHQLKSQLPQDFPEHQEDFVKMVYNLTSSSTTFFGVDEFLMMHKLTNRVASLSGRASEAYGKINFETLEASIVKYVEQFYTKDSSQKGKISLDALRELLSTAHSKPVEENSDVWNTVLDSIEQDFSAQVTMIEYLAHIPLFLDLEPTSVQPPPQPQ